jgi:Zn/Cd-binding protein ZinT
MTYIFNSTLDDELDRYINAEEALAANVGSNLNNTKKVYNVASNTNDFYTELLGGGNVKVHEEPLTALEDAQMYNQSLLNKGFTPTRDDFYAAGFDDAIINEGGFINVQPKSGITEPLTEEVQQQAFDLGFDVVSPVDKPIFKGTIKEIIKALAKGSITNPAKMLENLDTPEDSKFDLSGGIGFQIFDPETGEFDPAIKILSGNERDEINQKIQSGEFTNAVNLGSLLQVDEESGGGAKVLGSFAQFIGAYAGIGKFFRFGKSNFMKGFTGGAAADFLAFEGNEGRLSDMIYDVGEAFGVEIPQNVIVDFMQTDPTDPDYVGRFKNALEGGFIGVLAEPILIGLGKTFRFLKDRDITQEQVLPFVKAATNNMQETFSTVVKNVGERLNQPGQMPPLGSNFGNVDALRREANIQRFGSNPNDPVAKVEAPTENKPGIIAFHGSASDFNEFKLEEIGTGEGNQAFGYGLYFSDVEDIAKFYRDAVGAGNEVTYKGRVIKDLDEDYAEENNIAHMVGQQNDIKDKKRVIQNEIARTLRSLSGIEQSIKDFNENPKVYPLKFSGMEITMDVAEGQRDFLQRRLDAALTVEKNIDKIETKPSGKMYQVSLNVKDNELLDYDGTFEDQSPFAQQAILNSLSEMTLDDAVNLGVDVFSPPYNGNESMALEGARQIMLDNFTVVRFLNDWSVLRGTESSGEELLQKHGVKGIKYKANKGVGSRIVPETGEQNYVIFDDKIINIMKKYGIAAPVAVSSIAVKSSDQEDET